MSDRRVIDRTCSRHGPYVGRRCSPCLKERNRLRHEEAVRIIRDAKTGPCLDCRIEYPYYVMDLDHTRGKSFTISRNLPHSVGLNPTKLAAEILKCDRVCANCHRIREHDRREASSAT